MKSTPTKTLKALTIAVCGLFWISCTPPPTGVLRVTAQHPGEFEIYRVDSEANLLTEWRGMFNKDLTLPAGSYLLMTACSSRKIVIGENEQQHLETRLITFLPPAELRDEDSFVFECRKNIDDGHSFSRLKDHYEVILLDHDQDILVNMQPLSSVANDANVEKDRASEKSNHTYVKLGGLKVKGNPEIGDRFFIYSENRSIDSTDGQDLNQRIFLLPGPYTVELNGTKKEISIEAGAITEVDTGLLKVTIPPGTDTELAAKINGSPLKISLDGRMNMLANQPYQILTGDHQLRFMGAQSALNFRVSARESKVVKSRSLIVKTSCSKKDWACLGKKEVFLFEPQNPYPFAAGATDVPLLFWQQNVLVSLSGLDGIKLKLPDFRKHTVLRTFGLRLEPQVSYSEHLETELLRLEGLGTLKGVSYDIEFDAARELTVLEGSYKLVTFYKDKRNAKRYRQSQSFSAAWQSTHGPLCPQVYLKAMKTARSLP